MFIVMNRFQINEGHEEEFETMWRGRERYLDTFDGFRSCSLLRNETAADGKTEYISHTIWRSRADFEVWRNWVRRAEALYALVSARAGETGVGGIEWANRRLAGAGRVIDFEAAASTDPAQERYLRQSLGVE